MVERGAALVVWMTANPGTAILFGVFALAWSYIIGAALLAIRKASSAQQQAEERRRLDRIVRASQAPPKAAGHPHRRVG